MWLLVAALLVQQQPVPPRTDSAHAPVKRDTASAAVFQDTAHLPVELDPARTARDSARVRSGM